MKPASGQKSASVWIFSWLILHRSPRAPDAPGEGSRGELRQLGDGQLAYVHAVQPPQLDLVEARRVAADALEREALDQLRGGQDGLIVARPPAEQRQVVAYRLGQIAGLAQLPHRRRPMAL